MAVRGKKGIRALGLGLFFLFLSSGSALAGDQIVFLGDSLTAFNDWAGAFDRPDFLNRGAPGDRTDQILARLGPILAARPAKIFIMAGANDLYSGRPVPVILENYLKILRKIQQDSPRTQILVQSALPVNESIFGPRIRNREIILLNRGLEKICRNLGLTYIDLARLMRGADGQLRPDLTTDGAHLTKAAYQIWQAAISEYLRD